MSSKVGVRGRNAFLPLPPPSKKRLANSYVAKFARQLSCPDDVLLASRFHGLHRRYGSRVFANLSTQSETAANIHMLSVERPSRQQLRWRRAETCPVHSRPFWYTSAHTSLSRSPPILSSPSLPIPACSHLLMPIPACPTYSSLFQPVPAYSSPVQSVPLQVAVRAYVVDS